MSEGPLDTEMSGSQGTPQAVANVLKATAGMLGQMPADRRLSFELRIWEEHDE